MLQRMRHIIAGEGSRPTRFHTQRGERIRPADALTAGRERFRGPVQPLTPWIAPASVQRLNQLLRPDMTLVELGSGSSTAWYASRVRRVISLEEHEGWAAEVNARVQQQGLDNCEVVLGDVAASFPERLPGANVVVVDHTDQAGFTRVDAIRTAASCDSVQMVVLDDSDRPEYREVDNLMAGWVMERFVGMRPRPLVATETTLYRR